MRYILVPQVRPETSLSDEGVLCVSDHEKYDDLPMAAALGAAGRPSGIMPLCCGSLCKYAAVAVGAATAFIQHPVKGFPRLKVTRAAAAAAGALIARTSLYGTDAYAVASPS